MKYSLFNSQSIIGWILLLIAIIYGVSALQFPEGMGEPGPSFIPFILSVGMILCSIGIIIKGRTAKQSEESEEYRLGKKHLFLILILILFILLINFLGFIITSLLFLFFTFRLYGVAGYIRPSIYSVVLTTFVYVFFDLFLKVPLDLM